MGEVELRLYERRMGIRVFRVLFGLGALLLLVTWPADLWTLEPRVRGQMAWWRAGSLVVIAAGLGATLSPRAGSHGRHLFTGVGAIVVSLAGWLMGQVGGLETPNFYFIFVAPFLTLFLPMGLETRVVSSLLIPACFAVAYLGPHPEYLQHPHLASTLAILAGAVAVSAFGGHRVLEIYRTAFKRERQLTARARQLEVLDERKRDFVAKMSHVLRTPLTTIVGYTELIDEDLEEAGGELEEHRADLVKIHSASQHLLALINDVLDLSKLSTGEIDLYPDEIDLAAMIDDVASTIRTLAEKNGNELAIDVADDVGTVVNDPTRVRQILLNLLSNSCKFTERGTIEIRVRRPGERVQVEVRDSGIGMTAEQVDRLFRLYSQADESTTSRFGGTGLGLAISRRLCRLMGGDLTVESAVGRGSAFTMDVPAVVASPS